MSIRSSRPHNPSAKSFMVTADKIAQAQGYKNHKDAVKHLQGKTTRSNKNGYESRR